MIAYSFESYGGLVSNHDVTNVITINTTGPYGNWPLPEFHDEFISEVVRKLRARLAQLLMWSRMATAELRRLELRIPYKVVQRPRQTRWWRRRVCSSSQRWRVWVP